MVAGAAAFTDPPAGQTLLNRLVRNFNIQNFMNHNAHGVERLGLRNRSGEAVQDKTVFAVLLCQPLFDNCDYNLIRNQSAAIHIGFGFLPQLGAVFQCLADNVAGADSRDLQFIADDLSLGTFARARCA